jgi:hypothetical protein
MIHAMKAGLFTIAIVTALSMTPASAQTAPNKCDGTLLGNGDCVSSIAAANARRVGVIFSQPKISETAFPVLPSEDGHYRYPNQLLTTPGGITRIGVVTPNEGG